MNGYIVFVRFFPNCREAFPYDRIANLRDDEVDQALEELRRAWWAISKNRREFRRQQNLLRKRIKEWNRGALPMPGVNLTLPWASDDRLEPNRPRHLTEPTTAEVFDAARWGNPSNISHRYPLALFRKQRSAESARRALELRVIELAEAALNKTPFRDEDIFFTAVNPRFSVVAVTDLDSQQIITVQDQIERLSRPVSKTPSKEEAYVRGYLPEIGPLLKLSRDRESGPSSQESSTERRSTRRSPRLEWLAKAMLIVKEHPDWSDRRIADAAGIGPSTLSRSPEYQASAQLARQPKKLPPKGHVDIDPETRKRRGIEAYDDRSGEPEA